jgi:sigma-54 dependent transcriptional regulator, acetoin dehydrogenase operon transcriptional activator AcoR
MTASCTLRDLFDDAPPDSPSRLLKPRRGPQRIARADGNHIWVQDTLALRKTGSSLEEQMLGAVGQVMLDHNGNVAAVARQLSISRTTVYARLRQLRNIGMLAGAEKSADGATRAAIRRDLVRTSR